MKKIFSNGRFGILLSLVIVLLTINAFTFVQKKPKKQVSASTEIISTNVNGTGTELTIEFRKGPEHNHPLMVIWLEDLDGNYIQTLFVARSIAKGEFAHGDKSTGQWQPGEILRLAALPYWAHKRSIINDKGNYMPKKGFEVPDAYSGATPKADFRLLTRSDKEIGPKFRILCEINQSWDWNTYWTNDKYPDDKEYKTSSQPAVVYAAIIDTLQKGVTVKLEPIGRSHQSGNDGNLYHDLETLTTALKIVSSITATVNPEK